VPLTVLDAPTLDYSQNWGAPTDGVSRSRGQRLKGGRVGAAAAEEAAASAPDGLPGVSPIPSPRAQLADVIGRGLLQGVTESTDSTMLFPLPARAVEAAHATLRAEALSAALEKERRRQRIDEARTGGASAAMDAAVREDEEAAAESARILAAGAGTAKGAEAVAGRRPRRLSVSDFLRDAKAAVAEAGASMDANAVDAGLLEATMVNGNSVDAASATASTGLLSDPRGTDALGLAGAYDWALQGEGVYAGGSTTSAVEARSSYGGEFGGVGTSVRQMIQPRSLHPRSASALLLLPPSRVARMSREDLELVLRRCEDRARWEASAAAVGEEDQDDDESDAATIRSLASGMGASRVEGTSSGGGRVSEWAARHWHPAVGLFGARESGARPGGAGEDGGRALGLFIPSASTYAAAGPTASSGSGASSLRADGSQSVVVSAIGDSVSKAAKRMGVPRSLADAAIRARRNTLQCLEAARQVGAMTPDQVQGAAEAITERQRADRQ